MTDRDRDSEPRPRSVGAPSGLCCRTDAPSCNQSKGDPRQEQKQTRGMRMPFLGCGSFSAPDNVLPSALASAGQPFRPKVDYFKYVGTRAVVAILRVDARPPSLPRRSRGSSRGRGGDCGDDSLRPLPGLPKAPRPARGCRCQGRFTTGGRRAPLWGVGVLPDAGPSGTTRDAGLAFTSSPPISRTALAAPSDRAAGTKETAHASTARSAHRSLTSPQSPYPLRASAAPVLQPLSL